MSQLALDLIAKEKIECTGILDLGNCGLTELPEELFELEHLEVLRLCHDFYDFENGKWLKTINKGQENNLKSISYSILKLTQLKELQIQEQTIEDFDIISELYSLEGLNLYQSNIKSIFFLEKLKNLKYLILWSNQIQNISSLEKLNNLQYLNLDGNQIQDISFLLPLIRLGKTEVSLEEYEWKDNKIKLYGNPIKNPPIEIVKQGNQAIINYFDSLKGLKKDEKKPINEVKILLIGEGLAGKTSLLKRFKGLPFDGQENQTHGVIIEELPFKELPVFQDFSVLDKVTGRFWDFGGQEIMHASHQFFLTQRSVYILVLDSRTDAKKEYWLKHIEKYGGKNALVFIVMNKIDDNNNYDVERRTLNQKYPFIQSRFYRISCKIGTGIKALFTEIAQLIPEMEILKTPISIYWHQVKEALEVATEVNKYINRAAFEKICNDNEVKKPSEQQTLLRFLNDLGIVLHFPKLQLQDFYVLDPHWVTIGVYKIINSKAIENGILKESQLHHILNEEQIKANEYDPAKAKTVTYSPQEQSYLVKIMEQFELLYPFENGTYLVPDLLPKEAESELSIDATSIEHIHFILEYDFLPTALISRFILHMKDDIYDVKQLWRTGTVLYHRQTGAKGLVKADMESKRIEICVSGTSTEKRAYFSIIHHKLWNINNSYNNLKIKQLMTVPHHPEIEVDYEELLGLEKMGEDKYPIGKLGKIFSVSKDFLDKINSKADRLTSRILSDFSLRITKEVHHHYKSDPQVKEVVIKKKIIQVFSTNPIDTERLRLGEEVKRIKAAIRSAKHREYYQVESQQATEVHELISATEENQPFIVHISGHSDEDVLYLENATGRTQEIPAEGLADFLGGVEHPITCVVLNACHSDKIAAAIHQYIPFVIGMNDDMEDEAAIEFSQNFYKMIGTNKSIPQAFKSAVSAIKMLFPKMAHIPVLLQKQ